MNPFVDANRQRKVLKLCMALDAAFDMWGLDPFSPAALEAVLAMDANAWAEATKHAAVQAPSETTRAEVAIVYMERLKVRARLRKASGT